MIGPNQKAPTDQVSITISVERGDAAAGQAAAVPAAAVGRAVQARLQEQKGATSPPREVWLYDPGYTSTACCRSSITFIDGDAGILEYRGYPIEALAASCGFTSVAHLLLEGTFPASVAARTRFARSIGPKLNLHSMVSSMIQSFPRDAHPMTMLMSAMAALSACRPAWNPALVRGDGGSLRLVYGTRAERLRIAQECISLVGSVAAAIFRHIHGMPLYSEMSAAVPVKRDDEALPHAFASAFLRAADPENMFWPRGSQSFAVFAEALDVLFVLHADHELNCSTAAMRHLTSAGSDVLTCLAAAIGALYGPLHGGANEAVLNMLEDIGSPDAVEAYITSVKRQERKLMGFGHRVYRSYDPRAKLMRQLAHKVLLEAADEHSQASGPTAGDGVSDPLLVIAKRLEKCALEDPYFTERKLYPNVDFYSGVVYRAMRFPSVFFPVLFAVARSAGWLAHWMEMLEKDALDAERKIVRPRQIYVGHRRQSLPPDALEKCTKPQARL
jgi:citrate synthase